MVWIQVADEQQLREKGAMVIRRDKHQLAVFLLEDEAFAIDNRCPHEGYPLKEGSIDGKNCVLTCQWHNWKFDLRTGKSLLGEDNVRAYPTRFSDGQLWVDVTEPSQEEREEKIRQGLRIGFNKRQYGRMTREVARLLTAGIKPEGAIREVIRGAYDKLEYGTTHAYPAAVDWLAHYDSATDDVETQIICITELLDHFSEDTLRQDTYPFIAEVRDFDGEAFLDAVEAEDENLAVAMVRGALNDGLGWQELEPFFARAALSHMFDFGHTLIYLAKTGELLARLGEDLALYLLLPFTRKLCYGTREDMLPDFRAYAAVLADRPHSFGTQETGLDGKDLFGLSIEKVLKQTRQWCVTHRPEAVWAALQEAGARNMLHHDTSYGFAYNNAVKHNVGWLDVTHAITFGSGVRHICANYPTLWYEGLLQMACFIGRNKSYVDAQLNGADWKVGDRETFLKTCFEKILDHGLGQNIFSCHLLKTATAISRDLAYLSADRSELLLAALNRFFNSPIKQKHARRMARQALTLLK